MTTSIETTHKIIGLAAAGASMLGMRLDDALRLSPGQLAQHIASLHPEAPTAAPPAAPAAEEDPLAFARSPMPEGADLSILGSIHKL